MEQKFDLQWDDGHVVPPTVYPDLEFLFQRMGDVTLEKTRSCGDMILDIGCGRCIDAANLACTGAKVIGIEPSETMVGHAKNYISQKGVEVALLRGVGEYLPFTNNSLTVVVCKGALDHFPDPAQAVAEAARVLHPQGQAVFSLANFESLGAKLAKGFYWLRRIFKRGSNGDEDFWKPPPDHTYKFDYGILKDLVRNHFEIEESVGVSLFCGLPQWGPFLSHLPRGFAFFILRGLDCIARHLPALSDVVVIRARPISERK
jgi:SAM-dependent methyltransferase